MAVPKRRRHQAHATIAFFKRWYQLNGGVTRKGFNVQQLVNFKTDAQAREQDFLLLGTCHLKHLDIYASNAVFQHPELAIAPCEQVSVWQYSRKMCLRTSNSSMHRRFFFDTPHAAYIRYLMWWEASFLSPLSLLSLGRFRLGWRWRRFRQFCKDPKVVPACFIGLWHRAE